MPKQFVVDQDEREAVAGSHLGIEVPDETSRVLARRFRAVTDKDPSYWDYSGVKANSNPLAYFQYPAMMVPRMQGDVIRAILDVFPDTRRTLDPFAGSGTILTESLALGLNSIALDINPMAILLCKVKAYGFRSSLAQKTLSKVLRISELDDGKNIEIDYFNREKWFTSEALVELSKVCRAIRGVRNIEMRRLMWVAFAEAVRINSNTRTSTYKLHIREFDDVERRRDGVRARITTAMQKVIDMYSENERILSESGIIREGRYRGSATVLNHDMRKPCRRILADALVSSPPYGDNHTTVTYGQHSFLPLCWIPLSDIDKTLGDELLTNTHSIDSASLGGRMEDVRLKMSTVSERSVSLSHLLKEPGLSSDSAKRLCSFFFDLDIALGNAILQLRPGSPIVLTLGNRCVSGLRVQTDLIVQELLESKNCQFIDTHNRAIPTKRMAHRNRSAGTMLTETLLVMRAPLS